MKDVVILSACRTPIGSFGGAFRDLAAPDLGAIVVKEAVERGHIGKAELGDVILGCVLQAGAGMNVARQAAIQAGVPLEVPAETVNRVVDRAFRPWCTLLKAYAAVTSTLRWPVAPSRSATRILLPAARWGCRTGHAEVIDSMLHQGLTDVFHQCHMGMTAEEVAKRYNVSRVDQDAFALESQCARSGRFRPDISRMKSCR